MGLIAFPPAFPQFTRMVTGRRPTDAGFRAERAEFLRRLADGLDRARGSPRMTARPGRLAARRGARGRPPGRRACSRVRRRADTAAAKTPPPGVPVTAADVVTRDVPVQIRAIGNVQALATVSVYSMISGQVIQVALQGRPGGGGGRAALHDRPAPLQAAL